MNATEVDNPKTWAAHSLLRIRGRREYHGRMIRCITIHPSSPVPATTESQLNIHCMFRTKYIYVHTQSYIFQVIRVTVLLLNIVKSC